MGPLGAITIFRSQLTWVYLNASAVEGLHAWALVALLKASSWHSSCKEVRFQPQAEWEGGGFVDYKKKFAPLLLQRAWLL